MLQDPLQRVISVSSFRSRKACDRCVTPFQNYFSFGGIKTQVASSQDSEILGKTKHVENDCPVAFSQ